MKRVKNYLEEYLGWHKSGIDYPYKYTGQIHPMRRFRSLRSDRYALLTFYLVPLLIIALALIVQGNVYTKIISALVFLALALFLYRSFRKAR